MTNRRINLSEARNKMAESVFIIGQSVRPGQVSFNAEPRKHQNKPLAMAEANRLAKNSGTSSFLVFELVGVAKPPKEERLDF